MTYGEMEALHALCFDTPPPWSAQALKDSAEGSGGFVLSAGHGFLIGRVAGLEAELLTLAVDPAHRRQGIARRLVKDFRLRSFSLFAKQAFLEVRADNDAALALYHATGFERAGERKDYYRAPDGARFSAIVMVCAL